MTSTDTPHRHWARRARVIGPACFALGFVLAAAQNVPPTTEPAAIRTTTVTVTASARATSRTPAKTVPPAPAKTTAKPVTLDGDGTYLVGTDILPGRWKTAGTDFCYWARLKNDTGDLGSIIANHAGAGPSTVTVKATDGAFSTTGCGTWTRQ